MHNNTKRPRQYAYEIICAANSKKRRDLLRKVPAEYREWVEHLVRDHFEKDRKRHGYRRCRPRNKWGISTLPDK